MTGDGALSPGFRTRDTGTDSFELKFLVDGATGAAIETWARERLDPDPHGDPALGGAYAVHTLYLDTPSFDVYHRAGSYGRRKYRARRYGNEAVVYLERKSRRDDRVSKRRTRVDDATFRGMMTAPWTPDQESAWFQRSVLERMLGPVLRVSYRRVALVGSVPGGVVRLTVDRGLAAVPEAAWNLIAVTGGDLLEGQCVLELKYTAALPHVFKDLIAARALTPRAFSKYRLSALALGLVEEE